LILLLIKIINSKVKSVALAADLLANLSDGFMKIDSLRINAYLSVLVPQVQTCTLD